MNILSCPLHGISDSDFCSTGHNWYFLATSKWGTGWQENLIALPKNATIVDATNHPFNVPVCWAICSMKENILKKLNINLVLAPGFEFCFMALQWKYPVIQYVNTFVADKPGKDWLRYLAQYHPEVPIVFGSSRQAEVAGLSLDQCQVIERGWDVSEYIPWEGSNKKALIVCNSMKQRTYFDYVNVYERVLGNMPTHLIGHGNDGIQKNTGGVQQGKVHEAFAKFRLLFNIDPVAGRVMYEALASGIPVVSIWRKDFEKYLEDGKNCFMSNDIDYLINKAKMLLEDKELAKSIGMAGQKTIKEHFSKTTYSMKWNSLFDRMGELNADN